MTTSPTSQLPALGRKVRAGFCAAVEALLEPLAKDIRARLHELVDRSESSRQAQERRDAFLEFDRLHQPWIEGTARALRAAAGARPTLTRAAPEAASAALSLIDDVVVEKKILASRLAMAVQERLGFEYNDILLRVQAADGGPVEDTDVLRPEVGSALVVEHWLAAGLSRETWLLAADVIQQGWTPGVADALRAVNKELLDQGVMPSIDLSRRVRRGAAAPARSPASTAAAHESGNASLSPGARAAGDGGAAGASYGEALSPLGRARARAQGLVGQLRQMLGERAGGADAPQPTVASRTLSHAIGQQAEQVQTQVESRQAAAVQGSGFHFDNELVQEVASDLRSRSRELKRQAITSSEKAVIEIVALIFQSILAEDRIPASVRLWFARLQMPVLRIALAEPEFFETLQHPARQLIDRMGACVLGFDASRIGGSALEAEIRRVVQMIEQYPDAGRRAFELAYTEFQAFLASYLTGSDSTQRVVTVAQQVEQKETMAVRYTIELRKMLEDVPVRDEIREFLFKVWTDVLAVAAVRHGPQHEATQALRRSASELVWAASAKPSRAERSQVIQQLPQLLQNLRQGMSLMGLDAARQEAHIKIIGDTLADAFQSKTAAIPRSLIDAIAERLASIEDVVGDGSEGDLPLVAESIEMTLGLDNEGIQVITEGGTTPNAAMQAWAREMEPGSWFRLDHNGQAHQVQYAWRSEHGQLHLFATPDGRSFLFQAGRLASYLQASLLVPVEDEALTVRATRDALARLDANPERLLSA